MGDYTVQNLEELDDMAVQYGHSPGLEARFARDPLGQWDAIRVPAAVTRNLEAGPDGAEVLAIGAPQARDTEMLDGWWED